MASFHDGSPEDVEADPPPELRWHWEAFRQLDSRRPVSATTGAVLPRPLAYSEIAAYASLHGLVFDSWEVELFAALDDLRVSSLMESVK